MKIRYILFASLALSSCNLVKIGKATDPEKIKVEPATFNTSVPIRIGKQIRVITYWGKNKKKKVLVFDTGATNTTADSSTTRDTELCKFIAKTSLGGKTPDGKKINQAYYSTDSISLGAVSFTHASFVQVSMANFDNIYQGDTDKPIGLLGANLLSKGVWEINFKKNILTFTSSIKSLGDIGNAIEIPIQTHLNGSISLHASFKNGVQKDLAIDLGFSSSILLSKKIFEKIDLKNEAVSVNTFASTVASKTKVRWQTLTNESIDINGKIYSSEIININIGKSNLIGLAFFKQFDFIIIDYLNKKMYLSRQ